MFGEVTAGPTGCRTWADGEKRDVLQMHSLRRIQALPALTAYTGGRIQGTLRNTADSADHQGPGIGRPQHRPRSYGSDASRSAMRGLRARRGRGAREESDDPKTSSAAPALISRDFSGHEAHRVRSVTPHVHCRIVRRPLRHAFKCFYLIDMGCPTSDVRVSEKLIIVIMNLN